MAISKHNDNILIGQGRLYLDLIESGADGAERLTGARDLGDAVSAALSVAEERVVVMSGSGPERKMVDKPRSVTRTLNFTLHDLSLDNLALFFGEGEPADVDHVLVVDEEHTVLKGRWYTLAEAGAGELETVRVSKKGGMVWNKGHDYMVDAKHGRIEIVKEDADIVVTYTVKAAARGKIAVGRGLAACGERDVLAALRYVEDCPLHGVARHYYAPRCSVRPAGDLTLMSRDGEQQIQLAAEVLNPADGSPALYVYGDA